MSIRIVVIRHAKSLSEGYADDSLRPLSEEGKQIQKQLTVKLRDAGIKPTLILTSPLLRAEQTAQIATDIFDVPFEDELALGNDFNGQKLLERLSQCGDNETVFLVGHAPTLGEFVNNLVGEIVLSNGISKSCAAVVDFEGDVAFGKGKFTHYYKPQ